LRAGIIARAPIDASQVFAQWVNTPLPPRRIADILLGQFIYHPTIERNIMILLICAAVVVVAAVIIIL
jgi:hypothetical protein